MHSIPGSITSAKDTAAVPLSDAALSVENLSVGFATRIGTLFIVNEVSFSLRQGETLALVGESGAGKTVTSLALMRLTPPPPRAVVGGKVRLRRKSGIVEDLLAVPEEEIRDVRGNEISMIFQEPMTSLNPVHRVGDQIAEAISFHQDIGRRMALKRAVELLELVGIPDPQHRIANYPHHLSGGMRQRVMIAMALSCNPKVLIADEPTTALDVTVQAQILELLRELQAKTGMAILFITHNLGVVAEIADRVMVMYGGRIVEEAETVSLFRTPLMPYTRGLLHSVPRMDMAGRPGATLAGIRGAAPDPTHLPRGCAFHPRCVHFERGRCDAFLPKLELEQQDHHVRCVRWREIAARES